MLIQPNRSDCTCSFPQEEGVTTFVPGTDCPYREEPRNA